MQIRVSIIIPIYNGQKNIDNCINSIYRQSLQEWEAICVDDGSTDNSLKVLEKFLKKDSRIRVIQQKNQGAGSARNNGLLKARGEYISFLDVDDEYYEGEALEKMVTSGENGNYDIVGSFRKVISQGEISDVEMFDFSFEDLYESKWVPAEEFQDDFNYQSFIFKRSFLENNKLFFPNYRRYQDPPFFLRALIAAGGFNVVPTFLYCYLENCQSTNYTFKSILDLIHGVQDTLRIAIDNGLDMLHKRIINRTDVLFFNAIMEHMRLETILAIIDLNKINEERGILVESAIYRVLIDTICFNVFGKDIPKEIREREVLRFLEEYKENKKCFESQDNRAFYDLLIFDRTFYNAGKVFEQIKKDSNLIGGGPCQELINLVERNKNKQVDNIIVWGTAPFGILCIKILQKEKIHISAICDNNESVQGTIVEGIVVESPKTVMQKYGDAQFLITAIKEPIVDQIITELNLQEMSNNKVITAFFQSDVPDYRSDTLNLVGFDELVANKETILKNAPNLSVEVVNRLRELTEVPIYLKRLNPKYEIELKLYSKDKFEPVIMAYIR